MQVALVLSVNISYPSVSSTWLRNPRTPWSFVAEHIMLDDTGKVKLFDIRRHPHCIPLGCIWGLQHFGYWGLNNQVFIVIQNYSYSLSLFNWSLFQTISQVFIVKNHHISSWTVGHPTISSLATSYTFIIPWKYVRYTHTPLLSMVIPLLSHDDLDTHWYVYISFFRQKVANTDWWSVYSLYHFSYHTIYIYIHTYPNWLWDSSMTNMAQASWPKKTTWPGSLTCILCLGVKRGTEANGELRPRIKRLKGVLQTIGNP